MSNFNFTTTKSAHEELDNRIKELCKKHDDLLLKGVGEWNAIKRAEISKEEDATMFRMIAALMVRFERTLDPGSMEKHKLYHAINSARAFAETAASAIEKGEDPFAILDLLKKEA